MPGGLRNPDLHGAHSYAVSGNSSTLLLPFIFVSGAAIIRIHNGTCFVVLLLCCFLQLFWFIPSRLLWNVSFTRVDPLEDPEVMQILAQDGPADEAMPEGAYTQLETKAVGTGATGEDEPRPCII